MKTKNTRLILILSMVVASVALASDESTTPTPKAGEKSPPGNGLLGQYFANTDFSGTPVLERVDAQVDFDWGEEAPAKGLPADEFCIRWFGQIEVPESGEWTFVSESDDGVRLKIDGKLVFENWNRHAVTEDEGKVKLEAGKKYDIKLEYYDEAVDAVIRLSWQGPSRSREIIPSKYFSPKTKTASKD